MILWLLGDEFSILSDTSSLRLECLGDGSFLKDGIAERNRLGNARLASRPVIDPPLRYGHVTHRPHQLCTIAYHVFTWRVLIACR